MTNSFSDNVSILMNLSSQGPYICGDINGDGSPIIDVADLAYLVDYMFTGGPEPPIM